MTRHNIDRCKRRRSNFLEEAPFLAMVREERKLKLKVLKLKECNKTGIGLPPANDTDEENSQTNLLFELF